MKKKSKKKPVNSRAKGARGEREAAKYLTKIGFPCGRMGRNGYSDADLKGIEKSLPNVHIEVKFGVKGMDIGTKLLGGAWEQSVNDSFGKGKEPVVLWKRPLRKWVLTWAGEHGLEHTTGDREIAGKLVDLNR